MNFSKSKLVLWGLVVVGGCAPTVTVSRDDQEGSGGASAQGPDDSPNTGGTASEVGSVASAGAPAVGGTNGRLASGGAPMANAGAPWTNAGAPTTNHAGNDGGGAPPTGNGGNGSVNEADCKAPELDFELAKWKAPELPTDEEAIGQRIVDGMPGSWHGIVTTPWVEPYEVTLTFTADGHYSGACAWSSNDCCVVWYYGTDTDTDLKRWAIDDVTSSRSVNGHVDVIYQNDTDFQESGYQGYLEGVELDATGDRLRFDFNYDTYGPLRFDLERLAGE